MAEFILVKRWVATPSNHGYSHAGACILLPLESPTTGAGQAETFMVVCGVCCKSGPGLKPRI